MMNNLTRLLTFTAFFAVTADTLRSVEPSTNKIHSISNVDGGCTVSNFADAAGGEDALAGLIGVTTEELPTALADLCALASAPTLDFVDSLGKGPQFLKNFLDGGTAWNDYIQDGDNHVLSEDASNLVENYDTAKTVTYAAPDGGTDDTYPLYFSNFKNYGKECPLGVIECCYKDTRLTNTLEDNAEMCALDMTLARQSNHIEGKSWTFYNTQEGDKTYCTGFAYEEGSFDEKVRYNTLFHLLKDNLMGKGYVKNIPGAPMCGCISQMPIVTNAACVKVKEGYAIDDEGSVKMNLNWEDCGTDLYSYYEALNDRDSTEKRFVKDKIVGVGGCKIAGISFLNEKMLVPIQVD
eukprot:CAMPEP_0197824344 /NCGR_PEP_ID=MMETSP1437-20131217/1603_1 /TAXON_ID=49252 ORGANISM="Eucampia antarctica, Strain CCMP1452" /NCGR_SAMPLE_ID=MMETSP1437 /ASSEMBLY_ACC=CAM_ASM_001096 /LENGTH=350 /DNA_ID=CAMNT_0043423939 /DNA_START=68 /DNA_END=1120 /DNA_ORIENTATION=+